MADNLPPGYHALSLSPEWLKQLAEWDGSQKRMNVMPGYYDPDTKKNVYATPHSVTGPVSGMAKAMIHLGDALHGVYFANEDQRGAVEDALNLAAGGLASGSAAPRGAIGMFAGAGSQTANHAALDVAKRYEAQGEAPGSIWDATGWFRGPDSKWKYEIKDAPKSEDTPLGEAPGLFLDSFRKGDLPGSEYYGLPHNKTQKLSDVLNHPELFAAYPDLENVNVKAMPFANMLTMKGAHEPSTNSIYLTGGKPDDMYSVLLHEIQHVIQSKEGFGLGGTPSEWWTKEQAAALKDVSDRIAHYHDYMETLGTNPYTHELGHEGVTSGNPNIFKHAQGVYNDFKTQFPEIHDELTGLYENKAALQAQQNDAHKNYMNLAGEVEARNTQERYSQGLGPETPPWMTQGYPTDKQLVRFTAQDGTDGAAIVRVPMGRALSSDFDVTHMGGMPVEELEELEEVPGAQQVP